MNELAHEWIAKAENDFRAALVVFKGVDNPIVDAACFHSQQCAEKYLKGYLSAYQVEFPRQHRLVPLLELCTALDETFLSLLTDLRTLEGYAVAVRYPGVSVTIAMAEQALAAATRVRADIRNKLTLP